MCRFAKATIFFVYAKRLFVLFAMQPILRHKDLKVKHRRERDDWPQELSIRIHRALSWLHRAEHCAGDPDSEFIFQWIAFNAAYGRFIEHDAEKSQNERSRYDLFLKVLIDTDRRKRIAALLFDHPQNVATRLIENKFVSFAFWNSRLFPGADIDWEHKLNIEVNQASAYEKKRNSLDYLMLVLSRLQVLRNQLMHGAATWSGKINREQVQDAAAFMRHFVPLIIDIMMDDPDQDWGDPLYPVQY